MKRSPKLVLKRETLTELGAGELVALAAGAVGALTDACPSFHTCVTVTAQTCVTGHCTEYCFYTLLCR